MIALIPARLNSKRLPGKNTKLLAGHPLISYTLAAAQQSGVFDRLLVCTDDPVVRCIADNWHVPIYWRDPVPDDQPDIAWVSRVLAGEPRPESFAILRPTAPFRTAATIQRAFKQFQARPDLDSLRAVTPVTEHPGKMWLQLPQGDLWPLLLGPQVLHQGHPVPWHSMPTQALPPVYRQTAGLEMAWTRVLADTGTISGARIQPFFTEGYESVDFNTPEDWTEAEQLITRGAVTLPDVHAHR